MDPFDDEFEFKPLTEGLGFHKKADQQLHQPTHEELRTKPAARRPEAQPVSRHLQSDAENDLLGRPDFNSRPSTNISDLIASLPPALDFVGEEEPRTSPAPQPRSQRSMTPAPAGPVQKQSVHQPVHQPSRPQIFQPLSRADNAKPAPKVKAQQPHAPMPYSPSIRPPMPTAPVPRRPEAAAKSSSGVVSGYRQRLEESFARAFPSVETGRAQVKVKAPRVNPQVAGQDVLTPVTAHFGAGGLDALMVTGMSTLLLVFILAITHVNLRGLLSNAETDIPTRIHLVLLAITVLQLYMLTAHSFFGTTLGEWAFEIQLGTDEEQKGALYPVQAALRTLLLTVTGFVILPGLSLLMKRDLLGAASGLKLYRRD